MKQGTMYASRVKKAFAELRKSAPEPTVSDADDPVRRLAVAILGVRVGDSKADAYVSKIESSMVDWNEVRVSSLAEIKEITGVNSEAVSETLGNLLDALQAIYDQENEISLDHLLKMGRRDARHYLEELAGVDAYGVASVILWSLGGHAIPVDDAMLQLLRDANLVHPVADRAEVQAFLERNISAADGKLFALIMHSLPKKKPTAKKKVVTKKKAPLRTSKKKKA